MDKKKPVAVKPYQFKKHAKKEKKPIAQKTKENIMIIGAIVLSLSCYFIIALNFPSIIRILGQSSDAESLSSSTVWENVTDGFTHDKETDTRPKYLKKYVNRNPDTVGYIKISGTPIDYPVVQANDNEYYISHGFNNTESPSGAIFMDYRCDIDDFSKTRNIILYGHRMKDGSMFKGLLQYEDKDFFIDNRIIAFDTVNATLRWKIFAVFETTTDFYYIDTDFPYDEMWVNFLNECHDKSIHKTNTAFYKNDIVLTLSTCTTETNGRFVVMAKLMP